MARRALLVGIDRYNRLPALRCSGKDAAAMARKLERQWDGYRNYHCQLLYSSAEDQPEQKVTRRVLMDEIRRLFADFDGTVLFYFSGHGFVSKDLGGFLVAEDGDWNDPGLSLRDLITLVNNSKAWDILLILDCCYAGAVGDLPHLDGQQVQLRQGVTVLAGSLASQGAWEGKEHSIFTGIVLDGLDGGAADVRGRVTAASLYAFVEKSLSPWQQRPVYKSYVSQLAEIRRCPPAVDDALLRELPRLFAEAEARVCLESNGQAEKLRRLRETGLLRAAEAAAIPNVLELTSVGRHYWHLAHQGLI